MDFGLSFFRSNFRDRSPLRTEIRWHQSFLGMLLRHISCDSGGIRNVQVIIFSWTAWKIWTSNLAARQSPTQDTLFAGTFCAIHLTLPKAAQQAIPWLWLHVGLSMFVNFFWPPPIARQPFDCVAWQAWGADCIFRFVLCTDVLVAPFVSASDASTVNALPSGSQHWMTRTLRNRRGKNVIYILTSAN